MEFPPAWDVFPAEEYTTATPRNPQELGVELLVQVRPNGRMLDNFRFVIGGSELIELFIPLSAVLNIPDLPAWGLKYSVWGRDITIRRNMATSAWFDAREMVQANEARVVDNDANPIDAKLYLDIGDAAADRGSSSFSLRWAICVGEDNNMQLQLQALPAPESSFSGKPAFRVRVHSIFYYYTGHKLALKQIIASSCKNVELNIVV